MFQFHALGTLCLEKEFLVPTEQIRWLHSQYKHCKKEKICSCQKLNPNFQAV
jgi:hypothetical protein